MAQISDPAPPAAAAGPPGQPRRRPRLYSISTVLALTLALLVLVTVAVVVTPLLYLGRNSTVALLRENGDLLLNTIELRVRQQIEPPTNQRSEEHTSELQSPDHLVCRLLLEKKKLARMSRSRH